MPQNSAFATAANIFAAPSEAFAAIKERPVIWLPLLAILLAYAAVSFVYLNSVDIGWMLEQQLRTSGRDLTDAQIQQAVQGSARLPPMVLATLSAITTSIAIALVMFLVSLYYTAISFATNDGIKLKQWFALACWCALPLVLGSAASIVNVLASDARFMLQQDLNPLSFGNLLSIDTEGAGRIERALINLDPTAIWSLVLSVLGYQALSRRSVVLSAAIVLAPIVAIVALVMVLAS